MMRYVCCLGSTVGLISTALTLSSCAGISSAPAAPRAREPFASVDRALAAPQASCATTACIYVANYGFDFRYSVTAYAARGVGNVAPSHTIRGSHTRLDQPCGVSFDDGADIYVTNASGGTYHRGSVNVYAAGAKGFVRPLRTITGLHTGLHQPCGIALNYKGMIYIANYSGGTNGSVTVYAAGAIRDAAPTQTISGSNTGLREPNGIALDLRGNIYVANFSGGTNGTVNVYAAGANGDAAPVRTIDGPNTGLSHPTGVAVGGQGEIYVTNYTGGPSGYTGSVTVYARDANGNVAPLRSISGPKTGLVFTNGLALYASEIYVTNLTGGPSSAGSIAVFAQSANGDVSPLRTIGGSNTGLDNPVGIGVRSVEVAGK